MVYNLAKRVLWISFYIGKIIIFEFRFAYPVFIHLLYIKTIYEG